jgi:hypothetical protein
MYEVRHQTDKTCADCAYYDRDIFEDSFGPYTEESCKRGHSERVGYSVDACDDYNEEN